MRKFFRSVARFIASIFAILFVITAVLAVVLTTISSQVFNASLYKNALVGQNIYTRLPEIIGLALTSSSLNNPCALSPLACSMDGASPELETCLKTALGVDAYQAIASGQRAPSDAEGQLAQSCLDQYGVNKASSSQSGQGGSSGGMPPFFKNLSAADWQAFITILLPPDELKTMVENTLDQVVAYINGNTDQATLSLVSFKERLAGQTGKDLIAQLIRSEPACTPQVLLAILSGTGEMIFCQPPQELLPILETLLQAQLSAAIPGIPDNVILIKASSTVTQTSAGGPVGKDPLTTLRTLRLIMRLSPLLPLVLLLLVTLFAVRSLKTWLRWWGIPFVISGVIALALGITMLLMMNFAWAVYVLPHIPAYLPTEIAGIGKGVASTIVRSLSQGVLFRAGILFIIGLAAWVGSSFIKSKTPPEAAVVASSPPLG